MLTQICGNALAAAGLSTDCAALPADRNEPGWFVVTHPSGQRFRFDGPAGQQAAATTVIQGLDLSPAGQATAETAALRTEAQAMFSDPAAARKLLRAVALVMRDEINALRAAVVPALPARTVAEIRQAIADKLSSGAADQ